MSKERQAQLAEEINKLSYEVMSAEVELADLIRKENQFLSIWSIGGKIQKMDHKSYLEGRRIRYKDFADEFDVFVPIEGPTWLDVWKACDQAIRVSQDCHHVFIESLEPVDTPDGERVMLLQTGS